jgi:hypothetical protein
MSRTKLAALLLVFAAACGGKSQSQAPVAPLPDDKPAEPADETKPDEAKPEPAPPPPEPKPVTVNMPASKATVKLTKPGKGKKTPLKYVFAVGPAGGVDVTMDMDLKMSAGISQAMTMKLGLTNEVLEVAADGTIKLKQQVTSASAEVTDQQGNKQPEAIDAIVGSTIEATMSPFGIPGERVLTTPPVTDPGIAQPLTQIPHMSIALPDKPVGTGATWEVTEPLGIEGIDATVTTTYKLVSRKGKVATIEGTSTISAGAGAPADQMKIDEIKGSGKSKFVLEDGKLLSSTDANQTLTIKATIEAQPGKPQPMEIVLTTHLVAAGK